MTEPPFELAHLMMLSLLSCVLGRNHHAGDTGFDFLGYRFGAPVLKLAEATVEKFVEQATRLYEQGDGSASRLRCLGPMFGGGGHGRRAGWTMTTNRAAPAAPATQFV
jgi:hypothetical protein